ncbi:MAG: chitobiase/beta-hexosaminidase C-terminal domain-containing protein [Armatimonadota bacterium]
MSRQTLPLMGLLLSVLLAQTVVLAAETPTIPPTAAGHPAPPAEQIAADLLGQFDLTSPECAELAALARQGKAVEAMERWRDRVVQRLRAHDFGEYGWHDYARHPRNAGAVEYLVGRRGRDDYMNSGMIGFVDLYGITGPPGEGTPINWYVNAVDVTDWGTGEMSKADPSIRRERANYPTFEFAKSFVARYWDSGDQVYLRKALEIMSDFSRNHSRGFWATYYANNGLKDTFVQETMHCDWRLNTNALEIGWRMKNFLKILSGFANSLGPDKPQEWQGILKGAGAPLSREQLERIPARQLAEIALSLQRDHVSKLIWFTLYSGPVPNQRAEGLKSLAFFAAIFPEFRTTPQLAEYLERGYDDFLSGNFAPDGGSLEQSFNYNGQDKEGLEEVLAFYGGNPPRFAEKIRFRVAARRSVDDALQTPLGGLPQVGNSHDVLGKNVWESELAAQKYWITALEGKSPVRPQAYTSTALPYSGFYAMRDGWGMKDLYLFFMNGRPQSGHSMRDNNAIQVTAFGRQLLVCGGDPTYGFFRTPEAKGADFFLSEASSLKNNTVIVDGRSQSKSGPHAARAYETPVLSRWHTSPRCDLVDGTYDLGYGDFQNNRDIDVDLSVKHHRQVLFIKPARLWLVEDRMHSTGDKPHVYSQVWNFAPYCEHDDYAKTISGFKPEQFEIDAQGKRLRTTDPAGPNIEMRHFGPSLSYEEYHGDREKWLGWYSAGIGDARPTVNIHANWHSSDRDTMLTLLTPLDTGQPTPVRQAQAVAADKTLTGLDVQLVDGLRLRYQTSAEPRELDLSPVIASARRLLVCSGPADQLWGVALGCNRLVIAGREQAIPADDFEFVTVAGGKVEFSPIFIPEVPIIAAPKPFAAITSAAPVTITGGREGYEIRYTLDGTEPTAGSTLYREPVALQQPATVKARFFATGQPLPLVATREYQPWQWPLRQPDLKDERGLTPGLKLEYQEHENSVRIYDLMLRLPQRQEAVAELDLKPFEPVRFSAGKWTGYLKVPHDGVYNFYLATSETASVFIVNPERDLQLPALARCGWWGHTDSGSAALAAGLHRLEVQYQRSSKNDLRLEIEGPNVPRQPIPQGWFFRAP